MPATAQLEKPGIEDRKTQLFGTEAQIPSACALVCASSRERKPACAARTAKVLGTRRFRRTSRRYGNFPRIVDFLKSGSAAGP